jgi:hypothetical protein
VESDLGNPSVKHNGSGRSQLRLDAIDALETHYHVTGARECIVHQPLTFAHAAAVELLAWLGFTEVQRTLDETVTAATPERPGLHPQPRRRHPRPVRGAGRPRRGPQVPAAPASSSAWLC